MYAIILFIALVAADPTPNGGLSCNYTSDCGRGGVCDFKNVNGTYEKVCICNPEYGNKDCSYHRYSKSLAGGLQIGISFFGVFGVGNFIIGHVGVAVGQLIMGLCYLFAIVAIPCILFCSSLSGPNGAITAGSLSSIIACIVCIVIICGLGWTLSDGGKMLQGYLPDSNGYDLY